MTEMVSNLYRRLLAALTTWPSPRQWLMAAAVGLVALAIEGAIGLAGGFLRPAPADWSVLPFSLLLAVFVPALGEEAVFRGLLIPSRRDRRDVTLALLLSTAAFVAWHVVEGLTFMPAASPIFLRADFLAMTAVLGLACGVLRHRTGSLWPAVAVHWLEVAIWQIGFGGGQVAKALMH
jgi:predicted Abi (CAAX) family protease